MVDEAGLRWGGRWSQGWSLDGDWLEQGGAWLRHGRDGQSLAGGGEDMGWARMGRSRSELIKKDPERPTSEAGFRTSFSHSSLSGTKMQLGAFLCNQELKAQGQGLSLTPVCGAEPGLVLAC